MQKMIGKMAKMFPMFIALGFMIVVIGFAIGYANSQTAAIYFSATKEIRETTLLVERASLESVGLWLPYFKFLGIGLILSGIVMALRIIIDNLKGAGAEVLSNLPESKRPPQPKAPWYGLLMPIVMMAGLLIFIYALILSLQNAELARFIFSNPLPTIDLAKPGSEILSALQSIHTTSAWLIPLKFFAISTEFLAIAMGLATIIRILSAQTEMLQKGIQIGRGN